MCGEYDNAENLKTLCPHGAASPVGANLMSPSLSPPALSSLQGSVHTQPNKEAFPLTPGSSWFPSLGLQSPFIFIHLT